MEKRLRRAPLLVRWHRWIALIFALPLLVQIFTGVALALRPEIAGGRTVGNPGNGAAPFSQSIASVRAAYPAHRIVRVDFPGASDRTYLFHLRRPGREQLTVEVDPGSSEVLGESGAAEQTYMLMARVHDHLALPGVGIFLVAANGCALLFLAISGVIVWWPGARNVGASLQWPTRGPARAVLFRWHRSLGAVAGLFLVALTVLGIPLSINEKIAPTPWQPPPAISPSLSSDARLATAQALFPGLAMRSVRFSEEGLIERILLHEGGDGRRGVVSQVRFDTASGALTGILDARSLSPGHTFMAWLYPLHSGQAAGLPGRGAVMIVGLATLTLGLTGVTLWWLRRPLRKT